MSMIPQNVGKAVWYALIIWLSGFIWGTIVFMIPFLKEIKSIPYISNNPAISFPIIIIWAILLTILTQKYFKRISNKNQEVLKLALTFLVVNLVLDLLVVVIAFGNGFSFYRWIAVWVAYGILITVPGKVAQNLKRKVS